jgi:hypothetical protein
VTGVKRYNWSHDVDQSQEVRAKLGYTIGVRHTTRVGSSDWSQTYDWSQDIRPESYLPPGIGHTTGVARYLHYKHA